MLANLLQLYRYDMSEVREYELTEHGTFVYRFLDHYWTDPGRHAFLIRHDGWLAGFAMVGRRHQDYDWFSGRVAHLRKESVAYDRRAG